MISQQDHERLQAYLAGELSPDDSAALESQLKAMPSWLMLCSWLLEKSDLYRLGPRRRAGASTRRVGGNAGLARSSFRTIHARALCRRNSLPRRGVAALASRPGAACSQRNCGAIGQRIRRSLRARRHNPSGVWHIDSLRVGQGLQLVGDEATADVLYPDGTRLEFDGDAMIREFTGGPTSSKRNRPDGGQRSGRCGEAAAGSPMILKTANAEVVVLGTKFDLAGSVEATYVETSEGAVRLSRNGRSIEVPAGSRARR